MHAFIRRAVCAAGLTGGVLLLGVGLAEAASADDGPVTTGQDGIVSGNQTAVGAQAPIDLSGNQVTVIGQDNTVRSTSDATTDEPAETPSTSPTTSGEDGIASGNQTGVDVQAPVNVSGNQVTAVGEDNTVQSTGSSSTGEPAASSTAPGATTSGEDGIASGNQTGVDVQAPINVSCNQVTVIGQDNSAECASGSGSGPAAGDDSATTTGESGLVSGNQTLVAVQAPVNAAGNQVTVIGEDNTVSSSDEATSGHPAAGSPSTGPTTSGQDGLISGNQTLVDVQAPINASGNQVTVIGDDNTVNSTDDSTTGTTPGDEAGDTTTTGSTTSGQDGNGSGNQTIVDVEAPIDASGNQVTVIGDDNTVTDDSTTDTTPGTDDGEIPAPSAAPQGQMTEASPASSGAAAATTQAGALPGAAVLPNTGASGPLLGLGLGGLLALLLGAALCRREGATVCSK